jgi:hypothetical protein
MPAAISWCPSGFFSVAMSLLGCVILIVQRKWAIAHDLSASEAVVVAVKQQLLSK